MPIRSTILIYWWRPSLPYSYALFNASKLTFVMIQRWLLVTDLESFASICFDVCPILSIRSKYMKAMFTLPKFQISHREMADTICIFILACLCAANPHIRNALGISSEQRICRGLRSIDLTLFLALPICSLFPAISRGQPASQMAFRGQSSGATKDILLDSC